MKTVKLDGEKCTIVYDETAYKINKNFSYINEVIV